MLSVHFWRSEIKAFHQTQILKFQKIVQCIHVKQKHVAWIPRSSTALKLCSHACILSLFSEVGCSGIPAMLQCRAKIQVFTMNFTPTSHKEKHHLLRYPELWVAHFKIMSLKAISGVLHSWMDLQFQRPWNLLCSFSIFSISAICEAIRLH